MPASGTLAVAGNAHTPTGPTSLGLPLGAYLARQRPGVRSCREPERRPSRSDRCCCLDFPADRDFAGKAVVPVLAEGGSLRARVGGEEVTVPEAEWDGSCLDLPTTG